MHRFRTLLFLFSCFLLQRANAVEITKHTDMPIPFAYLENLYFKAPLHFIAFGNETPLHTVICPYLNRPYQLIQIDPSKKKRSNRFDDIATHQIRHLDGMTILIMEHPVNYCFHFFHLLEHLVGIWAFYGFEHAHEVKRIVLAGDGIDPRQNWEGPNQLNRHILKALFPQAEVKTLDGFVKECGYGLVCLDRTLISDRAISYLDPQCKVVNKLLGAALPDIDPKIMQSFADAVHNYANTQRIEPTDQLRITYIKRSPPRCLSESVERRLIEALGTLPNVELQVKDFASISFFDQIYIIGNTDVLISVHGNGLSHLLFLPNTSCVMEIFPPNNHHLDYHLFADARGIDYYGILYKERAFIERNRAYSIGAYGAPNSGIDELDIDLILSAIESRRQSLLLSKKNRS